MSVSRKAAFLTTNLVLKWPVWILLRCLQRFSFFDYIFLVYPGDNSDLKKYCPPRLGKSWLFLRRLVLAGIISGKSRGLLIGVTNTAADFRLSHKTTRIVLERLIALQKFIGVKSVALAGRLPSLMEYHGIELKPPFVSGVRGTLFSVMGAIESAAKKHGLDPSRSRIGVVGVGKIGEALLEELVRLEWNIFGVDVRKLRSDARKGQGQVFNGQAAFKALANADIVVALTPTGADFEPYLKHLKPDAIVLDDTHPMIRRRPGGISFYKIAVEREGVRFRPKLPGYKKKWIPGCAVEAIVVANTNDFDMDQSAFNKAAKKIGLRAILV